MRAYLAILALLGCSAPKPEEPPLPPIIASPSAWSGSALTGARASPASFEQGAVECLVVECAWLLGAEHARLAPRALEAGSGLQIALGGGAPFRPVSGARGSVRLAIGDALAPYDASVGGDLVLAPDELLVAPGTTVGWRVAARADDAELARLDVHLAEDGRVTLSVVASAGEENDEGAWIAGEEQHFLDLGSFTDGLAPAAPRWNDIDLAQGGFALVFAGRGPDVGRPDLSARLRLRRVVASGEDELLRRTMALVGESASETERRARGWSRGEGRMAELAAARADLLVPEHGRAAWLHVANLVGADMAQDYGFLAEDAELAAAARVVHAALESSLLPEAQAAVAPRSLGIVVDGALLQHLAARAQDAGLAPASRALLLAHAGETGRWPATVDEVTRAARGLEELAAMFEAENLLFLEDPDPSARARAHDWLRARGKAVPAYDPLADENSREAALAAWYEEREQRP
jgi:hypothetical protein